MMRAASTGGHRLLLPLLLVVAVVCSSLGVLAAPCALDQYDPDGTACVACPAHSRNDDVTSDPGPTTCFCDRGFFSATGTGPCEAIPAGRYAGAGLTKTFNVNPLSGYGLTDANSPTTGTPVCPQDYWCGGGIEIAVACEAPARTASTGSNRTQDCRCAPGTYSTAGTGGAPCATCVGATGSETVPATGGTTGFGAVVCPGTVIYKNPGYFTCGYERADARDGLGVYFRNSTSGSGKFVAWEDPLEPSYVEKTTSEINGGGNYTSAYDQCREGTGTQINCLDQWGSHLNAPASAPSRKWAEDAGFDPTKRRFCNNILGGYTFTKGDQLADICIVWSSGNRMWRMKFFPVVDQFSLLQIQNSFNGTVTEELVNADNKMTSRTTDMFSHIGTAFQVEVNGAVSDIKHRYSTYISPALQQKTDANGTVIPGADSLYLQAPTCVVVPFWTILITLDQGVIQGIDFDDDCSLCGNDFCVDGNCGQTVDTCKGQEVFNGKTESIAQSTDCDFKLYVAWAGSDARGQYLSSGGRRLSQFRRWSLNAVYNQAANFDSSELGLAPPEDGPSERTG